MIFHVSTAEGAAVIRQARGEGLKVFAETCPQYLFMTKKDLDKPGLEGGKWMFSPPAREASDQEALWQALALGDLQVISSDHAPYAYDKTGKLVAGKTSTFKQIPNGMPGLEARLPVVFDEMVSRGRFDVSRFVEWTSTNPAKIYGLYPKKGTLAIGSDADVAIWDPKKSVTFADKTVKDRAGYTPWKGRTVKGWPTTVLLRGEVLVAERQAARQARLAANSSRARPARPPSRSAARRWNSTRSGISARSCASLCCRHARAASARDPGLPYPLSELWMAGSRCARPDDGLATPQTSAASSPRSRPAPRRRAAGSRR